MPADLIRRIDEYASRMSLNRTSATIFLVSTGLKQVSAMDDLLNKFSELEEMARARRKAQE